MDIYFCPFSKSIEKNFQKKHDFSISLHNAQNTKKMIQNATAYFFYTKNATFFRKKM